jgi:hypothetical protein
MAIDIDGFTVLRAIVGKPSAFPDVSKEASKAAHSLVGKQLTVKSVTIDTVRHVFRAIGEPALRLVLDGFKDSKLTTLTNKIDKHNVELKTSSSSDRRRRVIQLASGLTDPLPAPPKKPTKARGSASKRKPKSEASKRKPKRTLSSEAMAAKWDGTESDD